MTVTVEPIAAEFTEVCEEYPVHEVPYSDVEELGVWEEKDLVNPVYLSPTRVHTPNGDHIGDEA